MLTIAHRGFSKDYPENSILAFEKAIEVQVDGIEADVRLSKEGQILIAHDSYQVKSRSYIEKTSYKRLLFLPTLEMVLEHVNNRCILILEIKRHKASKDRLPFILAPLIEDKLDWIEVSSFDDGILWRMQELNSNIRLHKLIDRAKVLEQANFDKKYSTMYAFDIHVGLKDHPKTLELLAGGQKVIFWVVDTHAISSYPTLFGAMSDDPLILKKQDTLLV